MVSDLAWKTAFSVVCKDVSGFAVLAVFETCALLRYPCYGHWSCHLAVAPPPRYHLLLHLCSVLSTPSSSAPTLPPTLPPTPPPHYQAMCWLHPFPFSSNRATGAGGLEITCAVLCFRPDTVINHCPSHTSTYNNKDWLLCGGCRPIAFHCADAKLEVNGHSQTLLPCPQTVSSFRYLSISGLSAELLPALPGGPRLLGGGSELLLGLFGFDSAPIS